jgi:hypothetical protein
MMAWLQSPFIKRRGFMRKRTRVALTTVSMAFAMATSVGLSASEKDVPLAQVPGRVTTAVKARFPTAKIESAATEDEDGHLVYEVQLKQDGKKIDVTLNPQGVIELIETQMRSDDLPKEVKRSLAEKYPKAQVKLAETVVKVKEGKETLDCYELKLTEGSKTSEVKFAPDGTITHVELKTAGDDNS